MSIVKIVKKLFYRNYFDDSARLYRRFGAIWLLRYRNYIDRKLILGELYEQAQLDYAAKLISTEKASCFIDAGANFGLYSISLAIRCKDLQRIIAFEPDLRNFNHLSANVCLNGIDRRIETHRVGLSDRHATVHFLTNKGRSTGTSRIVETAPANTKLDQFEPATIDVDTLDSQTSDIVDSSLFLKIDVEGHEKTVISGAAQLLKSNKCILQIEILDGVEATICWLKENFGLTCFNQISDDYYFRNF